MRGAKHACKGNHSTNVAPSRLVLSYASGDISRRWGSSPGLCRQQLVVVGGALVVVLSVSDDGGQAFAHQSLCDVAGGDERTETRSTLAALATNPSLGQRAQLDPEISGFDWDVFGFT